MNKQMTNTLPASGYNWNINLSNKEIDSAMQNLRAGVGTKDVAPDLKKIAFALVNADTGLLKKLCIALSLDFDTALGDMQIGLIKDIANGYASTGVFKRYIEKIKENELWYFAEVELVKQSATSDKICDILSLYIKKRDGYLGEFGQDELVKQSATSDKTYDVLKKYLKKRLLCGSAEVELVKQSAISDKMYDILKKYIEKRLPDEYDGWKEVVLVELVKQSATSDKLCNLLSLYIEKYSLYDSAEYNSAELELVIQSATSDKARKVLKLYIEKYYLYESAELELVKQSVNNDKLRKILTKYINKYRLNESAELELIKLAYGNRKMTAILDFYKSKYPLRAGFIQRQMEEYRQKKQKDAKKRRNLPKKLDVFVEIANSLKGRAR